MLATIGAIMFVDRAGRRVLLLAPTATMCITQVILAVVLAKYHRYGEALTSATSVGVLIIICAYVIGHAIGLGPLGWLYPTEVQPLETRAAGAGINTASNMVVPNPSFPPLSFSLPVELMSIARNSSDLVVQAQASIK